MEDDLCRYLWMHIRGFRDFDKAQGFNKIGIIHHQRTNPVELNALSALLRFLRGALNDPLRRRPFLRLILQRKDLLLQLQKGFVDLQPQSR